MLGIFGNDRAGDDRQEIAPGVAGLQGEWISRVSAQRDCI